MGRELQSPVDGLLDRVDGAISSWTNFTADRSAVERALLLLFGSLAFVSALCAALLFASREPLEERSALEAVEGYGVTIALFSIWTVFISFTCPLMTAGRRTSSGVPSLLLPGFVLLASMTSIIATLITLGMGEIGS